MKTNRDAATKNNARAVITVERVFINSVAAALAQLSEIYHSARGAL